MKKGDKPSNLDPAWWESHKTKGFVEDPKFKSRLMFLNNHYVQYPKYDINSKDVKVMYDRVNMIRQMVAGLKETKVAIDNMLKKKVGAGAPDSPATLRERARRLLTETRRNQALTDFIAGLRQAAAIE